MQQKVTRGRGRKARASSMEVTSRDLAEAMKVSQSTISRAFTPGASISDGLRARIHAAAEEIGYRPNMLARSLNARDSKLIGFILARSTNLLYPELLYELSGRLAERGYQLLLFPIPEDGKAVDLVDQVRSFRVDAVFSTGVLVERQAASIVRHAVPLVMLNRVPKPPISSVSCDFVYGTQELTRRMLTLGKRRFGLVSGMPASAVGQVVESTLRQALAECPGTSLTVVHTEYQYESGLDAADRLATAEGGLPEAVIVVNDTVAAGCLDRFRLGMGLRLPQDLSLLSFEAYGPSTWEGYQITGMRQPIGEMASAAVDLLLQLVNNPARSPEQRTFQPSFYPGATAQSS